MRAGQGSCVHVVSTSIARSSIFEKRTCLSPGLLPTKDDAAVRPANVVARPDRDAWGIEDGPTMRKYFWKAFLRFDFDDNGRLSEHRRSDDCSSGRDVDARRVGRQACVCDGSLGRRLRSADEQWVDASTNRVSIF